MRGLCKAILSSIILMSVSLASSAQIASGVAVESVESGFRPASLLAPGLLLTSGIAIHCFAHESVDGYVRDRMLACNGGAGWSAVDDYAQYLPLACAVALDFLGVPAQHSVTDRLISVGFTVAGFYAVAKLMKVAVNSPRPDGTSDNSFPSGHTGVAFAGAELVRMEYGLGWGIGAYTLAACVGFLRIYNNRHWLSDTLAGAGLGILCAHAGEWLLGPARRLLRRDDVSVVPSVDPFTGSYGAVLAYSF